MKRSIIKKLEQKKINVLSLFDGISCGQAALTRAGIKYDKYFASEINKDSILVTQHNFPNTIQIGSVTDIKAAHFEKTPIDLLIGGSPCQGFSTAGKMLNFDDPRSKLFFEFVRLKNELKPKWFLLENVRMKQEWQDIISDQLGVKPVRINSKLVSAQLRDRYYWTNIPIKELEDRNIKLQDILTSGTTDREKARCLLESDSRPLRDPMRMLKRYFSTGFTTLVFKDQEVFLRVKEATKKGYVDIASGEAVDLSFPTSATRRGRAMREKIHTLTKVPNEYYLFSDGNLRYLNQIELERLQTLPEGYTGILTRNKAAGVMGDGWTVDVIAHIFSSLGETTI